MVSIKLSTYLLLVSSILFTTEFNYPQLSLFHNLKESLQDGFEDLPTGHLQASTSDKILLSEIAVDNEFIEIYNPNNHSVDLSDMYLTDGTFNPVGTIYTNIVSSTLNPGGGAFFDFHVRFPDGATIPPGAYQTVSLLGSENFEQAYGQLPTYELFEDGESADNIPDMREAFMGSIDPISILSNASEVVILYTWDGTSDLVQDVDYIIWGNKSETRWAIDKTGFSIDGPDEDMTSSTYLDDTPIANQDYANYSVFGLGLSFHRIDYTEGTQTMTGGNGINGADETSENLSTTWTTLTAPTPNADESCNSDITLNFPIGSGQYNANVTINAKGTLIESDKAITFAAGSEIIMSDNFEVQTGGTLDVILQTCR